MFKNMRSILMEFQLELTHSVIRTFVFLLRTTRFLRCTSRVLKKNLFKATGPFKMRQRTYVLLSMIMQLKFKCRNNQKNWINEPTHCCTEIPRPKQVLRNTEDRGGTLGCRDKLLKNYSDNSYLTGL